MPTHWTYCDFKPDSDLAQGDIMRRADALVGLLDDVHAHFCDEKYLGFVVVTQTCDLVRRRDHGCSTPYVNLAVIRSFKALAPILMDKVCGAGIAGLYARERKYSAKQLLERIFNQNEQALGLFYLHPDADSGIAVESAALLRVTIALRSEHYDLLREARCGRLTPEFSSKLGWLAGNLYSRVATPDWTENSERKRELDSLVEQFLPRRWVPETWVAPRKMAGLKLNLSGMNPEEAFQCLSEHAPPSAKHRAIERVREIAKELLGDDKSELIDKLADHLDKDQLFAASCKK